MNVNIREYIRNNFKKADASEIEESSFQYLFS